MTLITFTNTKGGVGKSTLASHLAIWLFDHGFRVALLDTDAQGTSQEWVRNAEPGIAVRAETDMDGIQKAVDELTASHDVVVADAPGEEGEASNTITLLSDVAIVPLQPTKPNVRALKGALKSIRLAHAVSKGTRPRVVLVLNCVRKRNVRSRVLREQLSSLGYPVARQDVRWLDALADSCDHAVTRQKESPKAVEAASDIEGLFFELFGELLHAKEAANG